MAAVSLAAHHAVDAALTAWRQGDIALGKDLFFVQLADLARPLTREAAETAKVRGSEEPAPDIGAVFSEVAGFVILTQTCDVVRGSAERPYLDVAPLVPVSAERLEEVRGLRRPAFAFVPAAASHNLVADLDRVMTVEKSVVATWPRTPGWTDDEEIRAFAEALARKAARFAFPDDFVEDLGGLKDRLTRRHSKQHAEGAHLRAVREIRVRAAPAWDAPLVKIAFWFIKDGEPEGHKSAWQSWLDDWTGLFNQTRRFRLEAAHVCRLEDITARDYLESDRLDFDQLSAARSA